MWTHYSWSKLQLSTSTLNDAEQADVDGDDDMDIEEEEQNCPFCQKLFRIKDKVEHHFIFH